MKALPTRSIAAAALAMVAFGAASAAHADRGEWHVSVGIQPASGVYVQPAPVYVQPRPAYVAPAYVAPSPYDYARPAPYGYTRPYDGGDRRWQRWGPYGDHDRDGIANVYDRDGPRHRGHARRFGPWGDLDRDGIPNVDDRDRDGDGVRNRHDRFPFDPYRY